MTKELKEHLIRWEKAMQSAKPILGNYEFPVAPRTLTVIGYISMLMEHQESIVILEFTARHDPLKSISLGAESVLPTTAPA